LYLSLQINNYSSRYS